MEIWLDTTDATAIKNARKLGILHGVTTNPALLSKANRGMREVFQELLSAQSGPIAAQVTAEDCEGMLLQADQFHQISKRIIIKVPVTKEGLKAIHQLTRQNVITMATALFHPNQALLAALAGANYVAPYLSKLEKLGGGDPLAMVQSILKIFSNYKFETKILAASIKTVEMVSQCAEMGLHAATLNDQVFGALIENNGMTLQSVEEFFPVSHSLS
jgi:transaldolase